MAASGVSTPGTPADLAALIASLLNDSGEGITSVDIMKDESNVVAVETSEGVEFFVGVTDA